MAAIASRGWPTFTLPNQRPCPLPHVAASANRLVCGLYGGVTPEIARADRSARSAQRQKLRKKVSRRVSCVEPYVLPQRVCEARNTFFTRLRTFVATKDPHSTKITRETLTAAHRLACAQSTQAKEITDAHTTRCRCRAACRKRPEHSARAACSSFWRGGDSSARERRRR